MLSSSSKELIASYMKETKTEMHHLVWINIWCELNWTRFRLTGCCCCIEVLITNEENRLIIWRCKQCFCSLKKKILHIAILFLTRWVSSKIFQWKVEQQQLQSRFYLNTPPKKLDNIFNNHILRILWLCRDINAPDKSVA